MIKITDNGNFTSDGDLYTKEDLINLTRLQKELYTHEKILFSIEECINIWLNYGFSLKASWLFFPDKDEEIISQIKSCNNFTSFEDWSVN